MPEDVVQRRKDDIYEVMGELVEIVWEEDGSSWSRSRKACLESACIAFYRLALVDLNLRPKLTSLVHTWYPEWRY